MRNSSQTAQSDIKSARFLVLQHDTLTHAQPTSFYSLLIATLAFMLTLSLSLSPSHSPFHSIPLVSSLSLSLSLFVSLTHTLPQSTKNKENAKCGLVFEFLDVKFPFFQIIKIARHEKVFSSKEKKILEGENLGRVQK